LAISIAGSYADDLLGVAMVSTIAGRGVVSHHDANSAPQDYNMDAIAL
jgi:hypothetical protein